MTVIEKKEKILKRAKVLKDTVVIPPVSNPKEAVGVMKSIKDENYLLKSISSSSLSLQLVFLKTRLKSSNTSASVLFRS